jgi:hypothetical protein
MAFDGLRSVIRKTVDTLTAPVLTAPAATGDGHAADPLREHDGSAPLRADEARSSRREPVYPCSMCSRPVGRGTGRCIACGTRLVLDVPIARASIIAGVGLMGGLLAGGLGVAMLLPRPGGVATAAATPGVSSGPGVTATQGILGDVPPSAGAALRGTTALNGRLAAGAERLARAIAAAQFPTTDVVRVLRDMSSDVRTGTGMVGALGGWSAAATQQGALGAFYAQLADEIDQGLAASVTSASSYKAAAARVLAVLERVPRLDASARSLAAGAGMDLPPVLIPDALR